MTIFGIPKKEIILKAEQNKVLQGKGYYAFDILKLVLAVIIVFYHYNYSEDLKYIFLFRGGYICTDVFFVISGFLLMKSFEVNIPSVTKLYYKKIMNLGMEYYIALLLALIVRLLANTKERILDIGIEVLLEIFAVQEWGIYRRVQEINGVCWYISALILCSLIFAFICKIIRNPKAQIAVFILIGSICSVAVLSLNNGLTIHGIVYGHISLGAIRGMIGLSVGACAYYVRDKIAIPKEIGYAMTLFIILASVFCNSNIFDFAIIPVAFFTIVFFSNIQVTRPVVCAIEKYKIRKLSYVLYLVHTPIRQLFLYTMQPIYNIATVFVLDVGVSYFLIFMSEKCSVIHQKGKL